MKKTTDLTYIALMACMIAICSWISIPAAVPFTLQTMGVFLAVGLLGGKRGTIAVLVYILMGAVGLPVFSGFQGGLGILLGNTGGYILGFLGSALVIWAMEKWFSGNKWLFPVSMLLGLAVCYTFGTIWFRFVYVRSAGAVGWLTVLGWCVIPFIIPDLLKIAVAYLLTHRLKPFVK